MIATVAAGMPIFGSLSVPDIPEKRDKITVFFGSVFRSSSIIGPLLGALLTDTIGWRP